MSISMKSTKAELFAAYQSAECDLRQARKELAGQRMLTSVAQAQAASAARASTLVRPATPCANRRFVKNGQLFERVPVGFNTFAIRPVLVAA